jgi:hypothetical protein
VALGIFTGAVVSGFTGFAFSAVAGAVLLHVMPPREAVPLVMVCSVLVQSLSLVSLRSLAPLAAGTLVGLALFGRVSDSQFRRVLLSVLLLSGLVYVF